MDIQKQPQEYGVTITRCKGLHFHYRMSRISSALHLTNGPCPCEDVAWQPAANRRMTAFVHVKQRKKSGFNELPNSTQTYEGGCYVLVHWEVENCFMGELLE